MGHDVVEPVEFHEFGTSAEARSKFRAFAKEGEGPLIVPPIPALVCRRARAGMCANLWRVIKLKDACCRGRAVIRVTTLAALTLFPQCQPTPTPTQTRCKSGGVFRGVELRLSMCSTACASRSVRTVQASASGPRVLGGLRRFRG